MVVTANVQKVLGNISDDKNISVSFLAIERNRKVDSSLGSQITLSSITACFYELATAKKSSRYGHSRSAEGESTETHIHVINP